MIKPFTPRETIITQKDTLIYRLAWNHDFGCYTRNGFQYLKWPEIQAAARWIIYFDIDGMKQLNDQLGKAEVNARIHKALGTLRSTDYVVAGQFFSGDEFVVAICEAADGTVGDPKGLIERLAGEFKKVDIKATYGFAPVKSTDLIENVMPVAELVDAHKLQRESAR